MCEEKRGQEINFDTFTDNCLQVVKVFSSMESFWIEPIYELEK